MGAALVSIAATVGAAVVLATLGGLVRLALLVRDTARETKTLTAAVARLTDDQAADHDRLGAVEAALTWGGRHRYDPNPRSSRYGN